MSALRLHLGGSKNGRILPVSEGAGVSYAVQIVPKEAIDWNDPTAYRFQKEDYLPRKAGLFGRDVTVMVYAGTSPEEFEDLGFELFVSSLGKFLINEEAGRGDR